MRGVPGDGRSVPYEIDRGHGVTISRAANRSPKRFNARQMTVLGNWHRKYIHIAKRRDEIAKKGAEEGEGGGEKDTRLAGEIGEGGGEGRGDRGRGELFLASRSFCL